MDVDKMNLLQKNIIRSRFPKENEDWETKKFQVDGE